MNSSVANAYGTVHPMQTPREDKMIGQIRDIAKDLSKYLVNICQCPESQIESVLSEANEKKAAAAGTGVERMFLEDDEGESFLPMTVAEAVTWLITDLPVAAAVPTPPAIPVKGAILDTRPALTVAMRALQNVTARSVSFLPSGRSSDNLSNLNSLNSSAHGRMASPRESGSGLSRLDGVGELGEKLR
jgi:hypothetical protein